MMSKVRNAAKVSIISYIFLLGFNKVLFAKIGCREEASSCKVGAVKIFERIQS